MTVSTYVTDVYMYPGTVDTPSGSHNASRTSVTCPVEDCIKGAPSLSPAPSISSGFVMAAPYDASLLEGRLTVASFVPRHITDLLCFTDDEYDSFYGMSHLG